MNRMHEVLKQNQNIWRLFTCEEEYNPSFTDGYDRFPYYLSSNRSVFEPLASRYLCENGYKPDYPDSQPFAVCLTHDIDHLYCSARYKLINSIRSLLRGDLHKGIDLLQSVHSKKIPLFNFQEIMNLEEQYKAKSSFYFKAISPEDPDFTYNILDLKGEIRMIADAGWEVGLHGGLGAYNNPELISEEKSRIEAVLGRPVTGYRNHFLRFRTPDTWRHLVEAGFLYDTTFGYADCVGFRNGMCHPFRPYDLEKKQEIALLEIPLIVMDGTLFRHNMKLDPGGAWEITRRLIDTTEQYNGVFTLVWHNTKMHGEKLKFYEKVLAYCHEKGAWMTSGEEILLWSKSHE